jgi:hypothetical protein
MRRREFITLIGGASLASQWVAHAQQAGIPVIGYLGGRSEALERPVLSASRPWLAPHARGEQRLDGEVHLKGRPRGPLLFNV